MNEGQGSNTSKCIINSNVNLKNVVDLKNAENLSLLQDTLKNIIDILIPHCGVYSKYAMIINDTSGSNLLTPNTFSKDGTKLLDRIEFMSPLQTYLKNVIAYIGREVDNRAKDGTTTAMLLSSLLLNECFEYKKKDTNNLDKITTTKLENIYRNIKDLIFKGIDEHTLNISKLAKEYTLTEQEAAGIIAYIQALSSSGGNVELAKYMKILFENTPREAWEYQTWIRSKLESDKLFDIEYQPFDYSCEADLQTMNVLNTELNTQWCEENVTVLAIPNNIEANDFSYKNIIDYLVNFDVNKSLLVFVEKSSPELVMKISKLNDTRNKPIVLCHFFTRNQVFGSYCMEIAILDAIASCDPYVKEETVNPIKDKHIFVAGKVLFKNHTLEFYNLFEHDNTKTTLHPNYLDPNKCKFYTDILSSCKQMVDRIGVSHNKDQKIKQRCVELIKSLIAINSPSLIIGGTTHDVLANDLVLQDALGATMTSLKNNFTINGILSIHRIINSIRANIKKEDYESGIEYEFTCTLFKMISDTIFDLISIIYKNKTYSITDILMSAEDKDNYTNILNIENYYKYSSFNKFIDGIGSDINKDNYPVIQPVSIYTEIFTRVGELIIKLMSVDKIVVPGGVFKE